MASSSFRLIRIGPGLTSYVWPRLAPISSGGGGGVVTGATKTAISDTTALAGQPYRRKSNGHVEVATGDGTAATSEGVDGVYAAAVTVIGAVAVLVPSGSRLAITGLNPGRLFRTASGTLDVAGSFSTGKFTNYIGYADATGIDVNVGPPITDP